MTGFQLSAVKYYCRRTDTVRVQTNERLVIFLYLGSGIQTSILYIIFSQKDHASQGAWGMGAAVTSDEGGLVGPGSRVRTH